jgi:hypothetical protein
MCYRTHAHRNRTHPLRLPLLAYFPYFGKIKVSLRDQFAVCFCMCVLIIAAMQRLGTYSQGKLKLKLIYDRQSVGQSVLVSGAHLGPATNFSFSSKFL